MTKRTNPAYATLAYRRAIVHAMVTHLREEYMALSSSSPAKEMFSEDVFREDSQVPTEAIQQVIEELEQEGEHLRLELAKFKFDKQESSAHGLLSSTKEQEVGREGNRKGRNRRGR
jgi:hypothetical protein